MKFDGRAFAQEIYQDLSSDITRLKEQGITPRLVVILVGQNPNSLSYIKQKVKWGASIGAEIVVNEFPENIAEQTMLEKIQELNTDSATHGIIVQLPLPPHLDENVLTQAVFREKDIDGFHIDSPYTVPVAQAVLSILEKIYKGRKETKELDVSSLSSAPSVSFQLWLASQHIVVIGKGKTAGHPIIELLSKKGLSPIIIDHSTPNPEQLTQEADIVISCVGKVILRKEIVKKDAIVIGVGLHVREDGKLQGDFSEEELAQYVSVYTPTPGGVGPVNVACLMQNLTTAAKTYAGNIIS